MSNKGFAREGVQDLKIDYRIAGNEQRKIRHLYKQKRYIRRRNFLNNFVTDCILYRNGAPFFTERKMTAFEMGRANRDLIHANNAKADKARKEGKVDIDITFWNWRIKDRDLFQKELIKASNDF